MLGISPITEPKTKVFVTKGGFHEKVFLAKEVSGRTVQLGKIRKSLSFCQSSATPEVVETSVEIAAEPVCGLRMKYCCCDNNGSTTYKEANDGP